jgi:hypothetical protein
MDGPPEFQAEAQVAWIRLFFNTSKDIQINSTLQQQCESVQSFCPTDNLLLRGNTKYPSYALNVWKQARPPRGQYFIPMVLSSVFGGLGAFFVLYTIVRRLNWSNSFKVKNMVCFRTSAGRGLLA